MKGGWAEWLWGVMKPLDVVGNTESPGTCLSGRSHFCVIRSSGLREPRVAHSELTGRGQSEAGRTSEGGVQPRCVLTLSPLFGVGEKLERNWLERHPGKMAQPAVTAPQSILASGFEEVEEQKLQVRNPEAFSLPHFLKQSHSPSLTLSCKRGLTTPITRPPPRLTLRLTRDN